MKTYYLIFILNILKLFNKINLKFILNYQINIFIFINYNDHKKHHGIVKNITKIIMINENKMIK